MKSLYKKSTFAQVISSLKDGRCIRNKALRGYYIRSSYVPLRIFILLQQYNAIVMIRQDGKGAEWGAAPGYDLDSVPDEEPLVKCVICGKWFSRRGKNTTCGDECYREWVRRWSEKTRKKCRPAKEEAPKKRPSLILSTGCQVVRYEARTPTDNGRCEKYVDCENSVKCLFEIPTGWEGFKCINDHPGYAEKESIVEAWRGDYANRSTRG